MSRSPRPVSQGLVARRRKPDAAIEAPKARGPRAEVDPAVRCAGLPRRFGPSEGWAGAVSWGRVWQSGPGGVCPVGLVVEDVGAGLDGDTGQ